MRQIISIASQDDLLVIFSNQIGAVGSANARKALARAVNRVTTTVHGRVVRAIRKQSNIPTAILWRQVKKRLASPNLGQGPLEGHIIATGNPLSLKHFQARQLSYGVKAKVQGKWRKYPSAFMGPRPGSIATKLRGNVFIRTTSKRFPIEMLFGPAVPEELVRGESERIFNETVSAMLPERIRHELGRLLND